VRGGWAERAGCGEFRASEGGIPASRASAGYGTRWLVAREELGECVPRASAHECDVQGDRMEVNCASPIIKEYRNIPHDAKVRGEAKWKLSTSTVPLPAMSPLHSELRTKQRRRVSLQQWSSKSGELTVGSGREKETGIYDRKEKNRDERGFSQSVANHLRSDYSNHCRNHH